MSLLHLCQVGPIPYDHEAYEAESLARRQARLTGLSHLVRWSDDLSKYQTLNYVSFMLLFFHIPSCAVGQFIPM
jgi:hypothetical protein